MDRFRMLPNYQYHNDDTGALETQYKKEMRDYQIYGNSTQDGTPSPDNPIEIQSVGEKTVNLFDPTYNHNDVPGWHGLTIKYLEDEDCFLLNGTADGTYSFTTRYMNIPANKGGYYSLSSEYISGTISGTAYGYFGGNDIIDKLTNWQTVQLINSNNKSANKVCNFDYITSFWFYVLKGTTFDNYKVRIQLQEGAVATEYESYGKYKIPIEVSNENAETQIYNIFLDEPLRKCGNYADYIDFKNGKLVREVSVVDDTGEKTIEESFEMLTTPTETAIELPQPLLNKGTNIIKVKTVTQPSQVNWQYYK